MLEHAWRLVTSVSLIVVEPDRFKVQLFNPSEIKTLFLIVFCVHVPFFILFSWNFLTFLRSWERNQQRHQLKCCRWFTKPKSDSLEESLISDPEDSMFRAYTPSIGPSSSRTSNLREMLSIRS